MKKFLSLILAILLVASLCIACKSESSTTPTEETKNEIQVESKPESTVSCKNCASQIAASSKYCPSCGALLSENSSIPTKPEEPPVDGNGPGSTPIVPEEPPAEETGTAGLEFYPLMDGTYGVKAGKAYYLSEIVIPATYNEKAVTRILDNAFKDCPNLASVTIPASVTTIDKYAFCLCAKLTNITIPASVTTIGNSAFAGCSGLTDITIGDSVISIGQQAFYNCTSLESIVIPDSVTDLDDSAFLLCSKLTVITYRGSKAQWAELTKDHSFTGGYPTCTVDCTDGKAHYGK